MDLKQPARKKLSRTIQRLTIMEELRKVNSHPTAHEVYEMVRRRLPRVSLTTVYRNLQILADRDLIRRLDTDGTPMRFDGEARNHYHLRCVRCGRVDDAPVGPFHEVEKAIRAATDYEIAGHRLEFTGLCPRCRSKRRGQLKKKGRRRARR